MARWFGRRPAVWPAGTPVISFTFDDFPRSALFTAGQILEQAGVRGTYYISLGLMKQVAPTGEIFHPADLSELFARGHEAGCHTFDHHPAWETPAAKYEASVVHNAQVLADLAPNQKLETHSYPINYPRPATKRRLASRFRGCRCGGQTFNLGQFDLNHLSSFFLEQSRDDLPAIERVIDANAQAGGWLVFSTHDVTENPTRYGCVPALFEKVVRRSVQSGARVLMMSRALDLLRRP